VERTDTSKNAKSSAVATTLGKATDAARVSGTGEPAAEWVDVDSLKPWKDNPRKRQPVSQVAASIERYGFAAPIVARKSNREIIAGHTRWKAAKQLGLRKAPVRFLDVDEKQAHELALMDNRTSELADWDDAKLASVLAGMDDEVKALLDCADEETSRVPLEVDEVDVGGDAHHKSLRETRQRAALTAWCRRAQVTPDRIWAARGFSSQKGTQEMFYAAVLFHGVTQPQEARPGAASLA